MSINIDSNTFNFNLSLSQNFILSIFSGPMSTFKVEIILPETKPKIDF